MKDTRTGALELETAVTLEDQTFLYSGVGSTKKSVVKSMSEMVRKNTMTKQIRLCVSQKNLSTLQLDLICIK